MNHDVLLEHAERSIAVGSKSFAAASRLFDPATRRSAVLLYAWCRHCDDVIDGQEAGHDAVLLDAAEARRRLQVLQEKTNVALAAGPLHDPAFAALREVARRHDLARHEPFDLLEGFAQDVCGQRYRTFDELLGYCYHVAGVVGLMMARIMGAQEPEVLDRACDLGLAMQLTNIARDIVDDAKVGRCYVPESWLKELGVPAAELADPRHRPALAIIAQRLVDAAQPYYASAQGGMAALPWRSAWAVATAARVYRGIGVKVRERGAQAWDSRCSTSTSEKLLAVLVAFGQSLTRRLGQTPPRAAQLWTRPQPGVSTARPAEPAAVRAGGQ